MILSDAVVEVVVSDRLLVVKAVICPLADDGVLATDVEVLCGTLSVVVWLVAGGSPAVVGFGSTKRPVVLVPSLSLAGNTHATQLKTSKQTANNMTTVCSTFLLMCLQFFRNTHTDHNVLRKNRAACAHQAYNSPPTRASPPHESPTTVTDYPSVIERRRLSILVDNCHVHKHRGESEKQESDKWESLTFTGRRQRVATCFRSLYHHLYCEDVPAVIGIVDGSLRIRYGA